MSDPGDEMFDQDDYPRDWDGCCHDDCDADPLTGRAHCYFCGHSWYLTDQQMADNERWQAAYDSMVRNMEFRERWFGWLHQIKSWLSAKWRQWRPYRTAPDDDIPF